ncbi:type IV pilus secretin PilQ [Elusimicrobiota bacterium]
MKKLLTSFIVIGCLAICAKSVWSDKNMQTLDSIELQDNSVIMVLSGSSEPKYNVFGLSKPERIVVDFLDTTYKSKNGPIRANNSVIRLVRGGQFRKRPSRVARVVIELESPAKHEITVDGSVVILSVLDENGDFSSNTSASKSATESERINSVEGEFPATPITFDFEEADIRDVLRILSIKSGINIIYGSDVTGNITMRLENVPFDKAFKTILGQLNLVSKKESDNILRVVTPQQITAERSQSVTVTKIFPLNYADSTDMKASLDTIRTAEGRRGSISIDDRTNSLIVTDTPEGLESIEAFITKLDTEPQQVIIQAKIVEINKNSSFDIGIEWQYAGDSGMGTIGRSQAVVGDIQGGPDATIGATEVTPIGTISGGAGVTLPATPVSGQMGQIQFGVISDGNRLTGILSSLAQKGKSKLLSSPKVTTVNHKEAKILVGQKIPYTTTTVSVSGSTQATEFLDVGIKLTVTPSISDNQKIMLDVHPEVSLFIRADPAGPVIGTREAETTVLVNDGETVVIGGLITDDDRKLGTKVPLLGDIPVIGILFKRKYDTKETTELLVFITPTIMKN